MIPMYQSSLAMDLVVRGKPVPQGSIRHLGKGRPSVHANQQKLLPWRAQIQQAAEEIIYGSRYWEEQEREQPFFPLLGPMGLTCHFTMQKPVSAPKTRVTYPVARPDASHLLRAVEDALVAAGVLGDDSQFLHTEAWKYYPNEHRYALPTPGVLVEVFTITTVEL